MYICPLLYFVFCFVAKVNVRRYELLVKYICVASYVHEFKLRKKLDSLHNQIAALVHRLMEDQEFKEHMMMQVTTHINVHVSGLHAWLHNSYTYIHCYSYMAT